MTIHSERTLANACNSDRFNSFRDLSSSGFLEARGMVSAYLSSRGISLLSRGRQRFENGASEAVNVGKKTINHFVLMQT